MSGSTPAKDDLPTGSLFSKIHEEISNNQVLNLKNLLEADNQEFIQSNQNKNGGHNDEFSSPSTSVTKPCGEFDEFFKPMQYGDEAQKTMF